MSLKHFDFIRGYQHTALKWCKSEDTTQNRRQHVTIGPFHVRVERFGYGQHCLCEGALLCRKLR